MAASDLADLVRRLSPQPRGKGRLPEAPAVAGLPASKVEAVPSGGRGAVTGAGIVSPLLEQPYTGSTYYQLVSADGLFVFEYPAETTYRDDNGTGASFTFSHSIP